MASQPQVVVYGASGYTGKQICWKLATYGIPFVASGRTMKTLEFEMARVPEIQGHPYELQAAPLDVKALIELFRGKKVVYNVVGPFMQLCEPVVQAALEAGVHYLDTTGETDWMAFLRDEYGKKFAEKGLLLCPASSYMWAAGNIAVELALETPGIDSVDICYLADSNTSEASTKSFFRMLTKPQYFKKNGTMEAWPPATPFQVSIPGVHQILKALPWGGGGEPVWYAHDERVYNCKTLVAFAREPMMDLIVGKLVEFEQKYRNASLEEQEAATNAFGDGLVGSEPDREDPDANRSTISCFGRGRTSSVSVILRGTAPYIQTALIAAIACRSILEGRQRAKGFASPAAAFGARDLVAAMAAEGLHTWEAAST